MTHSVDPVLLEVFSGAFQQIADEIGDIMARTAYSNIMGDAEDFGSALLGPNLDLIGQGSRQPLHMGVIGEAARLVIPAVGPLHEGDIVISNDPFTGGTHLPDVMVFCPAFHHGVIVGYAANIAHWSDIGGRALGGTAADATEIYQEGLRILPLKLYERGKLNRTFTELVSANVRLPNEVLGDLAAQVTGCQAGARGMVTLIERYSRDVVAEYMAELHDYAERMMRAELETFPRGRGSFRDCLDDDGLSSDPVWIECAITWDGDELEFDFTGSSPQPRGPFGLTIASTLACVYYVLRSCTDPDIPASAGAHRPIRVIAPQGSVVNPLMPGSTGARAQTAIRACDVILGALSQIIPDRVPAAGDGNWIGCRIWGRRPSGEHYYYNDGLAGATGGSPWADGIDGCVSGPFNIRSRSVELLEGVYPVRFERFELLPGSGGSGRFRGGNGMVREFRLQEDGYLVLRNDRFRFAPYGLYGGKSGATSRVSRNGTVLQNQKATHLPLQKGDLITLQSPGAGGWGDPIDRDTAAIAWDVLEGKVTRDQALVDYEWREGDEGGK